MEKNDHDTGMKQRRKFCLDPRLPVGWVTEAPITMLRKMKRKLREADGLNTEHFPGTMRTVNIVYCISICVTTEATQQPSEAGTITSHLLTESLKP